MKNAITVFLLLVGQLAPAKMVVGEKPAPAKTPPPAFGQELLARGKKKLADVQAKKHIDIKSYHYCKAAAWLQFASELLELNPHDGAANQAVHEAIRLAEQMEKGRVEELLTGLFSDYKILRIGLWDAAQHFQKDPTKPCGPCFQAQLEIQMVAVGHQAKKSGDEVAQELIDDAEELERQMNNPTRSCASREELFASVSEPAPPAAGPAIPKDKVELVQVAASDLKTFKDKFEANKFYFYAAGTSVKNIVNVSTYGTFKKNLTEDAVLKKILSTGQLKSVKLNGFTDTQKPVDKQKKLSQERAESVKKDLEGLFKGVSIEAHGRGAERPLRDCRPEDKTCNLYNNRVEIEFEI